MLKMLHNNPEATGGPTTADVPEEMAQAYRAAGWFDAPADAADDSPDTKPDKADKTKGKTKAADAADGDTSTP